MEFYTESILNHENPKWREFAGMCFLCGLEMELETNQIIEYLFEIFHGLSLEEIKDFFKDYNELMEDIQQYFGK